MKFCFSSTICMNTLFNLIHTKIFPIDTTSLINLSKDEEAVKQISIELADPEDTTSVRVYQFAIVEDHYTVHCTLH